MDFSLVKATRNAVRYWWVFLLAGFLLIGIGVWILHYPIKAYVSLSLLLAIGMLVNGAIEIIFSISNAKALDSWGWTLAAGILDLAVGWYLLAHPLLTMSVLPVVVGFWVLFRGINSIGMSFELKRSDGNDWLWLIIFSLFLVAFGLLILTDPVFGVSHIILWSALAYIIAGINRIFTSFRLKRFANHE